jgi:SAM-dependent methyltransferase
VDVPSNWWQTFFSGLAVDCWVQAVTAEQTQREADFIREVLQVEPPAKLLDVPCGAGRHSLVLAARGFQMTAVDFSSSFLEIGRVQATETQLSIDWQQREMRDLPGAGIFDGAFCFGNSFGVYDDAGNAAFLQAVAQVLKPGARFLIDYPVVAESIMPQFQERSWYPVGNMFYLREGSFDHVHGRLQTDCTFVRNGAIEKKQVSLRVYTYSELCRLLGEAGFGAIEGFGSLKREPFRFKSPGLYLMATKQC